MSSTLERNAFPSELEGEKEKNHNSHGGGAPAPPRRRGKVGVAYLIK